jgi:hypothetical protein
VNVQALRRQIPLLGTTLLALDCTHALAQEALGEATQVDRARKARKEAVDRNLYNYKAGPVTMRFDALMGFEFNDNPNLIDKPKEVDFAFHPELDIGAQWPISQFNALSLDLGIGYVKYVNNTDLDHVIIAPNSEIAIDILTGDFTINVHERVSYTQDPVGDPSVSGTGDFGGIDNTVGVRADWDLNKLLITAGYDHVNFFSTGSPLSDVQERSSELFYGRGGIQLGPALRAGLELGGGMTDYARDVFADDTEFTVGPFVEFEVTKQLNLRVSGGYVRYDFDQAKGDPSVTNAVVRVPDSVSDFYANVTVEQQLNRFMSHRLSAGREARAGAASELITLWYVRYGNDWSISQYATLHTTLFYENGRERAGFVTDRLSRVGAGFGVTVPLSRKLSSTAAYQLLYKDSDQPNQDYLQNMVTLEFKYTF